MPPNKVVCRVQRESGVGCQRVLQRQNCQAGANTASAVTAWPGSECVATDPQCIIAQTSRPVHLITAKNHAHSTSLFSRDSNFPFITGLKNSDLPVIKWLAWLNTSTLKRTCLCEDKHYIDISVRPPDPTFLHHSSGRLIDPQSVRTV